MYPQNQGKKRGHQELMLPSVLSSAHPVRGAKVWCLRTQEPRGVHDWSLATPSWGLQGLWSSLSPAQHLRAGAELVPSRGVNSLRKTVPLLPKLKVKVLLCHSMDCSPPGSSVHGVLYSRILESVAMPFSRGSSQPSDGTQVSRIAGRCFTI